jgi:hypothetical protein
MDRSDDSDATELLLYMTLETRYDYMHQNDL